MSEDMNPVKINHFSGKIAVATDDGKNVTGHIGRCRSFMIIEINDDSIVSKDLRENTFTNHRMHKGHQHHGEGGGHSHTNLINGLRDCSYLIASSGGWRIVEDLKQNNITPLFAEIETIDEAIEYFIKGKLKDDTGLICNHN